MTQKAVQDALISHFQTQLSGYANLLVTYSGEAAMGSYKKGRPTVLVICDSGHHQNWPVQDDWEFLVDATLSNQDFAQTGATIAQNADRGFVSDVRNAVNTDANYFALSDAGLLFAKIRSLKADERNVDLINPHLFSCSTVD